MNLEKKDTKKKVKCLHPTEPDSLQHASIQSNFLFSQFIYHVGRSVAIKLTGFYRKKFSKCFLFFFVYLLSSFYIIVLFC